MTDEKLEKHQAAAVAWSPLKLKNCAVDAQESHTQSLVPVHRTRSEVLRENKTKKYLTNQTAPKCRFQKNPSPSQNYFCHKVIQFIISENQIHDKAKDPSQALGDSINIILQTGDLDR